MGLLYVTNMRVVKKIEGRRAVGARPFPARSARKALKIKGETLLGAVKKKNSTFFKNPLALVREMWYHTPCF